MEQTWFIKERIFLALFVAYNSTTNTQMLIIRNALLKRCKQLKKILFLPKWPLKSTAQTNYSRSETIGEESIVGTHGLSLRYILLSAEKNPWVSGMPGEKRVRKPLAFEDRNPGEVLFWGFLFLHFLWYFVSVNFLVSVIQKWSSELANVAQKWANTCRKGHNPGRSSREFGSVGENIYRRTGI